MGISRLFGFRFFDFSVDITKINLLPNERLESFWDTLCLGVRAFFCFCHETFKCLSCTRGLCTSLVRRLVCQKQTFLQNTEKCSKVPLCDPRVSLSDAKVSHSDPRVSQSDFKDVRACPKSLQSDFKVLQSNPQVTPKCSIVIPE